MLTLHHAWASSASRRVRLCLAEKGLDYESHIVDLARQQQHTPEYLAINPMGVVPEGPNENFLAPHGRDVAFTGSPAKRARQE